MKKLLHHLRKKFLAGFLAAVPLIIVVWAFVWIEQHTSPLAAPLGFHFPGLGLLIALVAVYLLGLVVTSLLGSLMLLVLDKILEHLPGFKHLYHAWKDIVLLPPSKSGMFHQVVLVPSGDGKSAQFGFTSGNPLPHDPQTCCVFLPNIPNPLTGRLMLLERASCLPVKMSVAEAFKFLLSTGNYLPPDLFGVSRTMGQAPAPVHENPPKNELG
jgi:uncharacterized membrane protein